MEGMKRAVIRHSVDDAIEILEKQPVRHDMIAELTIAQVMNRVSVAHLSIERTMKFIITEAGGPHVYDHDLSSRLRELRQYKPDSAKFLEEAFEDAVRHYRYNANAKHMKHLKSLESYLTTTGSDDSFQDIRYWELNQATDELIVRQIYLTIHMELLQALKEVLLVAKSPKDTVSARVEKTVSMAMFPQRKLAYAPGSDKERSVEAYIEWLKGFRNRREAMTEAVREGPKSDDTFMLRILREAYQELTSSTDPAVRYFAEILTVLPKQQRDAIPCVEWLGPETYQAGIVSTPGGEELGYIRRRTDGMWNITPNREGLVMVTAIAQSQTDARCHLADLLTRKGSGFSREQRAEAQDSRRRTRPVQERLRTVHGVLGEQSRCRRANFSGHLLDNTHGITADDAVRLEAPSRTSEEVSEILEGTVTEVKGHEVSVRGKKLFRDKQRDIATRTTGLRTCLRSLGYVMLRALLRRGNHVSFLSQRHYPGAIRPDSSPSGIGPAAHQAPYRGLVRRFLRSALPPEKWLPMADAACRLPRLAHLLQVFPAVERAGWPGGGVHSGAGLKKN